MSTSLKTAHTDATSSRAKKKNVLLLFGWNDPEGFEQVSQFAFQHNWHLELRSYFTGTPPDHWSGDGILYSWSVRDRINQFVLKQSKRCPIVAINSNLPPALDVPTASPDNFAAGEKAAEYLLSNGHRSFAYYSPSQGQVSSERQSGFTQVLTKAGFNVHKLISRRTKSLTGGSWEKHRIWLTEKLIQLPPNTAILALDDLVASDLIEVAADAGLNIPGDLAVIGMGNMQTVCRCAQTSISSIDLKANEVALQGAKMLNQLMSGQKLEQTKILIPPGPITIRDSSSVTIVHEPRLKIAIQYIKDNIATLPSIIHVAEYAGVSRRTLYNLFDEALGITPVDYLRQERTRRAWFILQDNPAMSHAEAAALSGFSCTRTFTRSMKNYR